MANVTLDSDVVIAFLDPSDDQHSNAVAALRPHLAGGSRLLLSASVYAEILVRPLQRGTDAVVEEFLDAVAATVVPVDRRIARRAAELRARHRSLRLPDALSLATALASSSELLTLDHGLRRVVAQEQPPG